MARPLTGLRRSGSRQTGRWIRTHMRLRPHRLRRFRAWAAPGPSGRICLAPTVTTIRRSTSTRRASSVTWRGRSLGFRPDYGAGRRAGRNAVRGRRRRRGLEVDRRRSALDTTDGHSGHVVDRGPARDRLRIQVHGVCRHRRGQHQLGQLRRHRRDRLDERRLELAPGGRTGAERRFDLPARGTAPPFAATSHQGSTARYHIEHHLEAGAAAYGRRATAELQPRSAT